MARTDRILDEWLVLAAQDGDAAALDRLVQRWHRRLWHHARNMTGRDDAASDVTQEAWLAVIKRLRTLQDPAAFPSWAYRVVTHKSVDWVRRQQRRRQRLVNVPATGTTSEPQPLPTEKREQHLVVNQALQELSVDHRAVVSMHYLDDMTTAQIADALGIPAGTVKSRLHHARQQLRTILKGTQP